MRELERALNRVSVLGRTGGKAVHPLRWVHEQRGVDLHKAMCILSSDSGMPLLPLSQFVPQRSAYSLLELQFMRDRCVLPFDSMAGRLLVATLDPYDEELQEEVARLSGRSCMYYLVPPDQMDAALAMLNSAAEREQTDAEHH